MCGTIILLSAGGCCQCVNVGISYSHKNIGKIELTLKEVKQKKTIDKGEAYGIMGE
jgi:hypothetical protein